MEINKENNKNYYKASLKEIAKFEKEGRKPTICMHVCCGPCSCYPLVFLSEHFSQITIIYTNSNIYPKEEYIRRFEWLKRYVESFNESHGNIISLVEFKYDNENYNKMLDLYGEQEEGKERCQMCYRVRMEQAYKYADEHNFDYFCTVMTISRQKNSQVLNMIGLELEKDHKTKYFLSDFKKNKGLEKGVEIRKKYDMYNQQYCGCIYSYNDYLKRINMQKEDEK